MKIPSKNKGEIKNFSNKRALRKFTDGKFALQEMIMGIFKA